MDIKKIIYVFRALGIRGIVRTIQYGLLRDQIEKRYRNKNTLIPRHSPGSITSSSVIEGGLRVKFVNAFLDLVFLTPNLIRISWEPGKSPVPYTLAKTEWNHPRVEIQQNSPGASLQCGHLEISVDDAGNLLFQDTKKNTLRKDFAPVRIGDEWQLSTGLKPEEHIYGLGERANRLNLRPGSYNSWNTDAEGSYSQGRDPLYIGTPIVLSLSHEGSHLTYFENSYRSTFKITDTFNAAFTGGMLRYYLIFGSLETIFSQLGELLGRPALPPHWVLGYHQCRWGYRNEADIREVIKGFTDHNYPLSAIHLDIDYMDGFRVFTFSPTRFSGIKQLSKELIEKGIHLVTTINPAVKLDPNYTVYEDGASKNVYCQLPNGKVLNGVSWSGWSVFPDFSNPAVRNWWQEKYQALLQEGISGIWHDMNEPSSFAGWGDKTLPLPTRHFIDGQGGNHLEAHNIYGLLMNQAGYDALRKYAPDKRPWILSRSGWAGLQRYAWNWTGDVETSWEALRQTIPTILGLGLSGHAFSGVDIGGFSGSPSAELYLRWFQLATFLPFFRTHSAIGTKPREPWVFGEPYTSIIRNFLELRYKLLPYLYSLSWKTSQSGTPPIRPLFWENQLDQNLWDIDDEFLLGNSILIAPIMDENAHYRRITLPPGKWYSYWNDQAYAGGLELEFSTSKETIPIFIKGGSLLPMDEKTELCFHVYAGGDDATSSQLYQDSGDGYGPWRVDTFQMLTRQISMEIIWDSMGEYPFPYPSVKLILHGKRLRNAMHDGRSIPIIRNTVTTPQFSKLILDYE